MRGLINLVCVAMLLACSACQPNLQSSVSQPQAGSAAANNNGAANELARSSPTASLSVAQANLSNANDDAQTKIHDCDTYTLEEGGVCTRCVEFERGRSNAAFKDKWLVRTTTHDYVINARANQKMTVSISSVESNAVFTIYEPNAETPIEGATEPKWSGRLTKSGDYRIEVSSARGNATYTLKVSVL